MSKEDFPQFSDKEMVGFLQNPSKQQVSPKEPFSKTLFEPLLVDPRDVPFVEKTIVLLAMMCSSIYLIFVNFNWLHFAAHVALYVRYATSFTLMVHCVNHRKIYKKDWRLLEYIIPYLLAPFYGQTWETFYYHHNKMHHIEDNGPGDLSCTLMYQRDNVFHFMQYFTRFFFLCAIELPIYFARKGWYYFAFRVWVGEILSLSFFTACTIYGDTRGGLLLLWLPFVIVRFGMMSGNWGQHAFIDPDRPSDDYVQSITCIEAEYNEVAFNDGYHTSHHLNPRRHWKDHPGNLLVQRELYHANGTLVFKNMDFHLVWFALMTKNFDWLASSVLVVGLNAKEKDKKEVVELLKRRLKAFTDMEVMNKYNGKTWTRPIYREFLDLFIRGSKDNKIE